MQSVDLVECRWMWWLMRSRDEVTWPQYYTSETAMLVIKTQVVKCKKYSFLIFDNSNYSNIIEGEKLITPILLYKFMGLIQYETQ